MKRLASAMAALLLLLSLTACGEGSAPDAAVDLDLTQLSSTMVYSEVYNMMVAPEEYMGRSVRMRGNFAVYQDPSTGHNYFAVIIKDATACCSQGVEFVLEGDYEYPADYPELGTEITVSGEFDTYMEGEQQYCQLIHAVMEDS